MAKSVRGHGAPRPRSGGASDTPSRPGGTGTPTRSRSVGAMSMRDAGQGTCRGARPGPEISSGMSSRSRCSRPAWWMRWRATSKPSPWSETSTT